MLMKYLAQAYYGKWLWMRLRKKYGTGCAPARYVLFPEDDREYNVWGISLLPIFMDDKNYGKVMLIVRDAVVGEACEQLPHIDKHIIKISDWKMQCLLRLFALVNLNEEMTIVSVRQPYDTYAERLLGKFGITKKDIVWHDIYRISDKHDIGSAKAEESVCRMFHFPIEERRT